MNTRTPPRARPQGFPLRLRPGAPHSVELLPGHPFAGAPDSSSSEPSEEEVVQSTPLEGAPQPDAAAGGRQAAGGKAPGAQGGGLAVVTSGDALPEFQVGGCRGGFIDNAPLQPDIIVVAPVAPSKARAPDARAHIMAAHASMHVRSSACT